MHRAIRSIVPSLLVAALTSSVGPFAAMANTLTVDDPSDGIQCSGATFTTISAAVAAAIPLGGDIVLVCDGVYTEQVVINKSLTLQGAAGQTPTFQAPLTMKGPKAIILVTNPPVGIPPSEIIDGLIINRPGGANCDSLPYRIPRDGGANAFIKPNLNKRIR